MAEDRSTVDGSLAASAKNLDIASNRRGSSYTRRERAERVLWALLAPAFRLSPRPAWSWRRWLLRACGARIGREVRVAPSARVFLPSLLELGDFVAIGDEANLYNLGAVSIGARATVSQNAHLCAGTHDFRNRTMPLVRATIDVGEDAWVCADAFVGPGVRVGAGAVVAARAVTVRDVPEWTIVAGNPARTLGPRVLEG